MFQDVVWQLDTNVISSSDGRRRTVQRSHPELTCITTLHVDNTTAQDEGTYECHAEGSTGDQHAQRLLLLAGELTHHFRNNFSNFDLFMICFPYLISTTVTPRLCIQCWRGP